MAGKGEAGGVRKQGKVRKTGGRGMLGGLAPAVDGFLQWTGSCSGRVSAADGFLQWTGSCSGRVSVVDGFL